MSTGEEIYGRLTRVSDPKGSIRQLSDEDFDVLMIELGLLSCGGVPLIIGALADDELKRRWEESRMAEEDHQ